MDTVKKPKVSALDVAAYILRKQGAMTAMKLQKLVWERLKDLASHEPMWRSASVTVRRPRAKIVPTRRSWTLRHVGRSSAFDKGANRW